MHLHESKRCGWRRWFRGQGDYDALSRQCETRGERVTSPVRLTLRSLDPVVPTLEWVDGQSDSSSRFTGKQAGELGRESRLIRGRNGVDESEIGR